MNAPTTTSADDSESGGSGDTHGENRERGWFTPTRQVADAPARGQRGPVSADPASGPDDGAAPRAATEAEGARARGRSVAAIRPVGRGAIQGAPAPAPRPGPYAAAPAQQREHQRAAEPHQRGAAAGTVASPAHPGSPGHPDAGPAVSPAASSAPAERDVRLTGSVPVMRPAPEAEAITASSALRSSPAPAAGRAADAALAPVSRAAGLVPATERAAAPSPAGPTAPAGRPSVPTDHPVAPAGEPRAARSGTLEGAGQTGPDGLRPVPARRPDSGPEANPSPDASRFSDATRSPDATRYASGADIALRAAAVPPPGAGEPGPGSPLSRPGFGSPLGEEPAGHAARPAGAFADLPESASADTQLIRRTLSEIEPISDKVTSHFYALLFLNHPELREMFPAAMDAQRDRLFKALLTSARHADEPALLEEYLTHLGRGHRKYGTQPEHYPAVGESLLGALARYAPNTWGEAAEAAWVRAYTTISQTMIDAAAENELHAPAWWQAEIVRHELRTPDIAVVTVRPDQPYPFRAGQYTSLETPWWPRVWRHYSFASAPRSDGLLSFHVKAVPAGWVSTSLVHHANPGDVIKLGAPAGSMVVDHETDNGLLCLGGGTGIAPIKALVEDVAVHGRQRPVEVFYGARSDHDLYDIETMTRLEREHPWLSVRPVISDGPTSGLRGPLPDAVRKYGPWNAFDAYLSGPPGLIRSGVSTLRGIGIPRHRIRHDSLEELVGALD
ncbi:globin domain-containing protein [Streptomyces buecherae]|uniref:globin domain-containing protein n=1 Tax=Streptomyces buecherae TaxID=2763006 RepID=UPI0027E38C05|nr:globin domain-containing protein [Streptomyces buecherae]